MISVGKKIHILGISGTFMAGVAIIAKNSGFIVSGHDKECYSPMKDQLIANGIDVSIGYSDNDLPKADCYIIGNSIGRGNPMLEQILMNGLPYTSGPEWLQNNVLQNKWVIAVAGTHGKTTTSSMVTWVLEQAGFNPSFLIGGVVDNLGMSARITDSDVFVIEADEYDTSFFDKRPKFMHYRPKTLIINNLEFDHADIYSTLSDISKQFMNLVKTVPADGTIIYPEQELSIQNVLNQGCWSTIHSFYEGFNKVGWFYEGDRTYDSFNVGYSGKNLANINWKLLGQHNASNAMAALIAVNHVGVPIQVAAKALSNFSGVKRRLELKGVFAGVYCYEDFAHHPTAIKKVLECLSSSVADGANIYAFVELGSFTIRSGLMSSQLEQALRFAKKSWVGVASNVNVDYDWSSWAQKTNNTGFVNDINYLVDEISTMVKPGDIVISFGSRNTSDIFELLRNNLLPAVC
jgi:UDP-N-acetylmuramate: L-alanyl-gamma-D-glutamyl-meso-diaminopimelate ligase